MPKAKTTAEAASQRIHNKAAVKMHATAKTLERIRDRFREQLSQEEYQALIDSSTRLHIAANQLELR